LKEVDFLNGIEDKEKLKRELKRVKEENRKLKHIISYGNISTLETLVDQYGLQPNLFEKNRR